MCLKAYLAAQQEKHRELDAQIKEIERQLSADGLKIGELKREKLLCKDRIARLERRLEENNIKCNRKRQVPTAAHGDTILDQVA